MKRVHLLLFICLAFLMSTTCKKDYYDGTELVLLNASLNNTNESIKLNDTLKVSLVLPPTIKSETGVMTSVNSVQEVLYNFEVYQVDTANTNLATGAVQVNRITSRKELVVSKGSMSPYSIGSVLTSTASPPFQSVLNIIPATRGVYYLATRKGGLKVNNSYEAFLSVDFAVPDKHWTLADRYIAGYSTAPEIISRDAQGYGIYWFRVK